MLQTPFVHLVIKQVCDRRQLIKVGAVTQSSLWTLSVSIRDSLVKQIVTRGRQLTKIVLWAFSLGILGPLFFPLLDLRMNTQFQRLSFPDSGHNTHGTSRAPLLCAITAFLVLFGKPGDLIRPGSDG